LNVLNSVLIVERTPLFCAAFIILPHMFPSHQPSNEQSNLKGASHALIEDGDVNLPRFNLTRHSGHSEKYHVAKWLGVKPQLKI
jgi:hypothetical protein